MVNLDPLTVALTPVQFKTYCGKNMSDNIKTKFHEYSLFLKQQIFIFGTISYKNVAWK